MIVHILYVGKKTSPATIYLGVHFIKLKKFETTITCKGLIRQWLVKHYGYWQNIE